MNHMVRLIIAFVVVIAIIITIVSFYQPKEESIKIGGAFSLTGAAADWGQDEIRAVELAIEETGEIEGKKLKLIVEDTKTDNTGTLNAVQKLITVDKVQVIIGPTWGDSFGAIVAPLGEQNKVVQMTPSGALEVAEDTIDYPYFFSTWYPQMPEIETHMKYMKSRNYSKVIIIHDQDPFNTKFSRLYAEEAAKNGVSILNTFEVPLGTTDFRTILARIKSDNPDVILLQIFEVGEIGSAIKQMRELGINAKLMSTASAQTENLLKSYADYAEGVIIFTYPYTSSAAHMEFTNKFKTKYGKEPGAASAGTAYDATKAVLATLKTGAQSGEEIKEALYRMKVPGIIVDEISFNQKGQINTAPFILKTVRSGKYVELKE